MLPRSIIFLFAFLVLILSSSYLNSAPVPKPLAEWQDWVKYQQEYRACPNLENSISGNKANHLCAWPGEMKLEVSESGGQFSQIWQVIEKSRVPLPGDLSYWPHSIQVNRQSATILNDNGQPYLLLPKGEYSLQGEFSWDKRPESLRIPSQVSLLSVMVNGQQQPFVSFERDQVWLGSVEKNQTLEKDHLKLWVNRLIQDGHPMEMTVAIYLEVGGRAREQKLTQFLPQQVQLMQVQSGLNTRIDSQGFLWVQLKPGEHEMRLMFKIEGYPQEIKLEQTGDDWPAQEIWAYQDNTQLRSTQIEGVSPIDAEQAHFDDWRHLPNFVVSQADTFKLVERQRGISHNFDSLSLERQMWLSFDQQNFYFFDQIQGQKSTDWRVNTIADYQLTQLSNHGKERLITLDEKNLTGAEIRTPQINIQASGEVAFDRMQQASGWNIAFNQSRVTLNIPPGRKLLYIGGADNANGDWISRWKLIDLFFILVTVALVFKCFGLVPSVFALVTLVLGYHEYNMPLFGWFNLVVALSLWKTYGEKLTRALNFYRLASIALLAISLAPFLAEQVRFSLHPQLEKNHSLAGQRGYGRSVDSLFDGDQYSQQPELASPMVSLAKPKSFNRERESREEKITITGSRLQRSALDSSYQQDAVIQAGKGKPNWQWHQASYSWNGPIKGDEPLKLMILSEGWVKIIRIALILFSTLWLLSLLMTNGNGEKFNFTRLMDKLGGVNRVVSRSKASASLVGMVGLLLLASVPLPSFAADFPSEQLLQTLRERTYPKSECEPECVSLALAELKTKDTQLELKLEYQSGATIAALLPDSKDWRIEKITLNQQPLKYLWKNQMGSWISLPKGNSMVTISASLKDKSDISIRFSESPKRFLHQVKGWEVSGVNLQRLTGNSVQLNRLIKPVGSSSVEANKDGTVTETQAQEQSIGNLFFVTRRFNFASQWSMETSVERRAPQLGTITTEIPLLAFEQPLALTEQIKDGKMRVVIPANQSEISWSASVDGANTNGASVGENSIEGARNFELMAMQDNSIDESWEILVYPNWHIEIEGVPAVQPLNQQGDDYWLYQYFPRANETLTFTISRPPSLKGDPVAIKSVIQNYQLSKRKTSVALSIDYKATRAEQLRLNIGDAEVKSLQHDGKQINLAKVDGVLSVNLNPGEHQLQLQLEKAQEIDWQLDLTGVGLNQAFTNLTTQVTLPENRWLITASGPGYGPAIIYWGELIFFALLAIGLSQLKFSPLNYWQWLVLGLGMSTFSWPAMALVAAWLLGSEWRRQNPLVVNSPILQSWLILLASIVAVFTLITAVPSGLLQSPDMGVVGNGSYGNSLIWFLDKGEQELAGVKLISLPIWSYKGLMLLWATWLSFSLIRWIGWTAKDLQGAKFKWQSKAKKSAVGLKSKSESESESESESGSGSEQEKNSDSENPKASD